MRGGTGTALNLDDQATLPVTGVNTPSGAALQFNFPTFLITDQFVQRSNPVIQTLLSTGQILPTSPLIATVNYTNVASLSVRGGLSQNVFNVQATAGGTPTSLIGGSGANSFSVSGSGNSLDPIQGPVTITGAGSVNSLSINDQGTSAVQAYDLSANQFTRTSSDNTSGTPSTTVSFSKMQNVAFYCGSGHEDVVNVDAVSKGTSIAVYGNNDYAEFLVGGTLDAIQGPLALHGGANAIYNFVTFTDYLNTVGHQYTLTANTLQRSGMANISFDGLQAVTLSTGDNPSYPPSPDTVSVQSTAANVNTSIEEGNGDVITLGAVTSPGKRTLQNLLGPITVLSSYVPSETPSLIVDDSGDPGTAARVVTIAAPGQSYPTITGISPAPITIVFNVGGKVSLLGSSANETFAMQTVPLFGMSINGMGGANALDYSGYTGDVTVDLPLHQATGLSQGIQNILNVTGGIGNNLLIGDANANVLTGGTGRNIIIGGNGADTITGGGGDNILIAGRTSYDQDLNALDAIFAEWIRSDLTFQQRLGFMENGGDSNDTYLLNGATVSNDAAADILTGGEGSNWFFYHVANDQITNFNASTDQKTAI